MNMELDNLKDEWRKANEAISSNGGDDCRKFNPEGKTSLDRLAVRYRRFAIISAIMSCFSLTACYSLSKVSVPEPLPWWFWLVMLAYFLIAALMDYWLYRHVSDIDCATMSVDEVLCRTMLYRKRHFQFMMVLLPMALGILGYMAMAFSKETEVLYAMLAGFLVGLAIGAKTFIDFMRDYRRILN